MRNKKKKKRLFQNRLNTGKLKETGQVKRVLEFMLVYQ